MKNSSFRFPLRTVIIYAVAGFIWILLSDRFLELIATDVQNLTSLQTYKGWMFVLASAILIYALLFREFKLLNEALNKQIEAEETIKKERDLLKRINDTVPVGLTLVGSNGDITLANHQAEKILGLKRDQITRRTYNAPDWKITDFHGKPFPVENLPFSLVAKTHQPVFDVQHAIEWMDGRRVLLSINVSPLISAGGDFDGMVASIEDVTEKVMAENALRTSEQQLKSYIDNAGDAIYILEQRTGQIRNCNKRACQDLGYSIDELLKLSASDIEVTLPSAEIDSLHSELKPGEVRTIEGTHKRKDGTIFPVEIRLSSLAPVNPEQMISVVRDITERKRAEESLQQSEYLLRAIIDNAPFGAHNYELNSKGQLVFIGANKVADTILHIDNQQFIGKTIEDAFPPLVQTEIPNIYKRVAQTGESYHVEQLDYNEKNIRGVFDVHAMQTGPNRMTAFFLDITERKRAQVALQESEARSGEANQLLEGLFDAIPDVIGVQDGQHRIIRYNAAGYRLLGLSPEQVRNRLCYELIGRVKPCELCSTTEALHTYKPSQLEKYVPELGLWLDCRSYPVLDSGGNLIYIIEHLRDITERKRVEEALIFKNIVFDTSIAANSTADINGIIIDANESFLSIWDYPIKNEVIGKPIMHFLKNKEEAVAIITALNTYGKWQGEFTALRKDGSIFTAYSMATDLKDSNGKTIGYQSSVIDITERKRAEDNLRRRAEELATLLKISQEFALTRDIKIILQMTTDRVTELTQLKSSAIYLLEGETLRLWATTPPLPPQFPEELRNASLGDHPHIRKAISTGMPVFLPDTATADLTPAERAITELRSLRSILYIPLIAGTKALGTLIVNNTEEPRILSDAEINFCNTLANIAAMAIENAILDEEIRKNVEALQQEILNRKRSAVEIKKMNEQLRALAVRLQTIREEERTTIAREIHDELGQMLTGLKYELMWIEKRIDPGQDDMQSKVAEIQVLIDSTIKTVRKISAELRPGILDLGLAAAIEWQMGEFRRRTGLGGRTEISDTDMQMSENTSTQVFRIFQEILTNIMRHANASSVDIILKRSKNDLILIVSDNGKGMHPGTGPDGQSLGLLGMQERAIIFGGTLSITSAINKGTTVEVLIPIEHSKQ